jgi:general secretion pathway protein G
MLCRKRELVRGARHGFTLMEVLVVVAIILVLAGLGGYYFLGQAKEAQRSAAKIQVKTLTQATENYALDHNGNFPNSLADLLKRDQNGKGPYLKTQDALIDPWGNPYQYNAQGANNGGMQPDIWAESAQFGKIGNWSQSGQ